MLPLQVYYILQTTEHDADMICYKVNDCDWDELYPPPEPDSDPPDYSQWRPAGRQYTDPVPLDEAIKIVHLTDIHLEEMYSEVCTIHDTLTLSR